MFSDRMKLLPRRTSASFVIQISPDQDEKSKTSKANESHTSKTTFKITFVLFYFLFSVISFGVLIF